MFNDSLLQRERFAARFFGSRVVFELSDAATAAGAILFSLFPDDVDGSANTEAEARACSAPGNRVPLEAFQDVAVTACRKALMRWGGVLLCDDVGLGKTYVALELVRDTISRGLPVLVVIPSSLRAQWIPLLRKHAPVARFITHSQLSRGSYPASLVDAGGLLVIDEAHAFRSHRTRRYRAAVALARGRQVCLITATPVNNSIWDLYHLLRLFTHDASFLDVRIPHLHGLFEEVLHAASTPPPFRRLLRLIMVRRSRDEIRADILLRPLRMRFPELAPPVAISHEADTGSSGAHGRILDAIAALNLSAVDRSSAGLLRFLLLKRIASSPLALRSTVTRLLRFHCDYLAAAGEGLVLSTIDFASGADRSGEQLPLRSMLLRPLRPGEDSGVLRAAAAADIQLFESVLRDLTGDADTDDKLARLRQLLTGPLRAEKVLVFTEFRETAVYLWRQLVAGGGVGLVHGGDAYLGSMRAGRHAVIERFARARDARRAYHPRERVRILIATDVLSEGLNLQDCAHVVSYDLPWNPVRLIQRIGRIDRLGSPHERVHTYNFVPDRSLEDYLRILGRLRIKLHSIGMSLGLEHPVLAYPGDGDATPKPPCPDDHFTNAELRSWIRRRKLRATSAVPIAVAAIPLIQRDAVCFIVRNGSGISAFACNASTTVEITPEAVAASCMRSVECDRVVKFDTRDVERIRRRLRRLQRYLDRPARGPGDGPGRARVAAPATFIARRLRAGLAVPGADANHIERVDRALARLAGPLSVATCAGLEQLVSATAGFEDVLRAVEEIFCVAEDLPAPPELFEIVAIIVPPSVLYADHSVPLNDG